MSGQIWGGAGVAGPVLSQKEIVRIPCSDLVTNIVAAVNVGYFRVALKNVISEIRASLLVASSAGVVTVDVNKNGGSIFSTRLTLDVGETTSRTAAIPCVIANRDFDVDDIITIDIDTAGANARGLIVSFLGVLV